VTIKGEKAVNVKNSRYLFIFITLIISFGLLNSGCTTLDKVSFWKNKNGKSEMRGSKEDRMDALEEKVATLSYSLGSLTTENYELKKNFSELDAVKSQLNKEYTKIKDTQAAIEKIQASNKTARSRLKGELAKTKVALEKIKQHLAAMELEKNSLKAKLVTLESTRKTIAQTEKAVDKITNVESEKSDTGQSRKSLIKETQENRKTSLVEELLNKAIRLYREEHFEEAIAKWEEVLALDPSKLEAKFNIEIAQDRIKEKQIQSDLKKTHIQKNR
jgi:tetratricopeptide (TPR) repeat protein